MASTTKIMTLILALEYGNPDDVVTVSSYAAKMPEVRLGLHAGDRYVLQDLLYSMMLESHNDSACAVAEQVGGSVEAFAQMMNRKAAEIGLHDTYFITPNGLDAEDAGGVHQRPPVSWHSSCGIALRSRNRKKRFRQSARHGSIHSQAVMVHGSLQYIIRMRARPDGWRARRENGIHRECRVLLCGGGECRRKTFYRGAACVWLAAQPALQMGRYESPACIWQCKL